MPFYIYAILFGLFRMKLFFKGANGETAHTSRHSIGILKEIFLGHLISLRDDIGWPARSPDLNPCDFFLWGYLKSKVHSNHPQCNEQLKDTIRQEIATIPYGMTAELLTTFGNALKSLLTITDPT